MSEMTTEATANEGQAVTEPTQGIQPPAQEVESKAAEQKETKAEPKQDDLQVKFDEVTAKLKKYEAAETERQQAELKKKGDYEKLIQAKDDELNKLKTESLNRTKTDNLKKLFKAEGVNEKIIDSQFPGQLVSRDYFDENGNLKKGVIKTIKEDFPFLEAEKQPTAPTVPTNFFQDGGADISTFTNQKANEIRNNPTLMKLYAGKDDFQFKPAN